MVGFIYELREAGVPVSVQYILEFYQALRRGIAANLEQLFLLARLVFVKRVEHYDIFEQVFSAYFLKSGLYRKMKNWEELLNGKPGQGASMMDAQSMAHLLILGFIALGNIAYFMSKKKNAGRTV